MMALNKTSSFLLLPEVMLRAAFYSYLRYDPGLLPSVLDDLYFRVAVSLASPVFYRALEVKDFQFERLSHKEKHTAMRYYNRMSHRPIPFGAFASFAVGKWADAANTMLDRPEETVLYLATDRNYHSDNFVNGPDIGDNDLVTANPLCYRVGKKIRFVQSARNPKGKYDFMLSALEVHPFYKMLLDICTKKTISFGELVAVITRKTGITMTEAHAQLKHLLDIQLLLSSKRGNLLQPDTPLAMKISEAALEKCKSDSDHTPWYAALERPVKNGGPDVKDQQELERALHLLHHLALPIDITPLERFKRAFLTRFDRQKVPLLLALDPDGGIAYHDLLEEQYVSPLKEIRFPVTDERSEDEHWSPLHRILMRLWKRGGAERYSPLYLDDVAGELDALQERSLPLPPTTAVLFRKADDQLVIDTAGGATATSLAGRFSVFNDDIHTLCIRLAEMEARANPEIIFTDLVQFSDDHVDNINQRRAIYPYQLPLNAFPVPEAGEPLMPSDLLVSVRDNRIVLESKRHQKRVIPRLSSAFNYRHNKMAIFRFLCDLQFQEVQAGFSFDLEGLFPGLNYYPRVCFGRTILSLAKWRFSEADLRPLFCPGGILASNMYDFRMRHRLPHVISMGEDDRQLIFNLTQPDEAVFFVDCIRGRKNVRIQEWPLPGRAVKSSDGALAAQYLGFLHNPDAVYKPLQPEPVISEKVRRDFFLGAPWLYIKIYATSVTADGLLHAAVSPVLKRFKKDIDQWFFVRYQEQGQHLRIRIKINSVVSGVLLATLNHALETTGQSALVHDFQGAVYRRELERYPPGLIDHIENVFCTGSDLALAWIDAKEKGGDKEDPLSTAMFIAWDMIMAVQGDISSAIMFCGEAAGHFMKEFRGDNDLIADLDKSYRRYQPAIARLFESGGPGFFRSKSLLGKQRRSLAELFRLYPKYGTDVPRDQLLSDMIHMEMNRLFTTNQRRQEFVVYYFLNKYFKSVTARERRSGAG